MAARRCSWKDPIANSTCSTHFYNCKHAGRHWNTPSGVLRFTVLNLDIAWPDVLLKIQSEAFFWPECIVEQDNSHVMQ